MTITVLIAVAFIARFLMCNVEHLARNLYGGYKRFSIFVPLLAVAIKLA